MLAFKYVPDRHTADYLSDEITNIIRLWNIERKVTTATIDGASNINLAIEKTTFIDKLNCITHIMNLVTKDILNKNHSIKILDLVKKCRNLVCTFKHSNYLSDQLKKVMQLNRNAAANLENVDCEVPPVRTLKQEVPTRWNSTFIMLKSVLDAHDCIKIVLNNCSELRKKYSHMLLNGTDIEILEDLVHLLLPFYQFTKIMSGSKYVTISIVIPGITRLLEILQLYESQYSNVEIEKLARSMKDDLEERTKFFFTNPMVISATFLDPRYRKFHFIKDDIEKQTFISKAKSYIVNTYLAKFKTSETEVMEPPPSKKKRISKEKNFSLLSEDDDLVASSGLSEKDKIELEIRNYCEMKVVVNEQSNPLEFYKNNSDLLKCLGKFSKLLFSITASSTPSEESFSTSGDIISDQRSRLTPEHAEELVLISQNKRLGIEL